MQLWLRPGPAGETPPSSLWSRFAGTWLLNLTLLALIAWRAPRADAGLVTTLLTVAVTAAVLLGLREAVMLALLDLAVPISPFIGSAARHVREWSMAAWGLLVTLGVGPLIVTLIGG